RERRERIAALPYRRQIHLTYQRVTVRAPHLGVLDKPLIAEADLYLARVHHLAELLGLAPVRREITLMLAELLLEPRHARRVAVAARLRGLAQHALEPVDLRLQRVDLQVHALDRLRSPVPLLERLRLSVLEIAFSHGHDPEPLLECSPASPGLSDLTRE